MVVLGNLLRMQHPNEPPATDAIHVDEQDHYNDDWVPPFNLRDVVRIRTDQKFSDYYKLYEEIGEGKFGKVYRCVEKETNLELAAKCIRLKKDADLVKVEKEVRIMTQMRHKCITQIYDAFAISENEIILIMEIVSGGELFDRVVDDNYILTETAVAMIMYQICEAIRYIHSQKIIHLDLKPENIMCVSLAGNQIKLIDFGLAQYYDGQHDLLFMAGTPEFAAPEVIKFEPLDFHTDMWSLGVIAYILLSGQSPFLGDNIALTYCNVEKGKWSFCEEFDENGISDEARDFITKLLIVDKNKRMLPEDCLQHPWIMGSLERARNKSLNEKPLDTGKLRSYVRNKRFRRLVFGVLFINSVSRMLSTLQTKNSKNGIQYMKNMINATVDNNSTANSTQSLAKSAFAKRRRNVTDEKDLKSADEAAKQMFSEQPSTSQEGQELHAKLKRLNNNHENKNTLDVPLTGETSSSEALRTASPKLIKRRRDKASRPKPSTSRKASSSEQEVKKSKQGSSGTLKAMMEVESESNSNNTATKSEKPELALRVEPQKPESSTKINSILAKFQNQNVNQSAGAFKLPVACAVTSLKKHNNLDVQSSVESAPAKTDDKMSAKPDETSTSLEKLTKPKKLKKLGSTKKSKPSPATVDLNREKEKLKPANSAATAWTEPVKPKEPTSSVYRSPEPKSTDSVLESGKSDQKSKSLMNSLLQKFEKNSAPPIIMAVSSVVSPPKVEQAKMKMLNKVLRIEPIEDENSSKTPSSTTSVKVLNLKKKVLTEKRANLKQKEHKKQTDDGDHTSTKTEREDRNLCELNVRQKTTVKEANSEAEVLSQQIKLVRSSLSKERGKIKAISEGDTKHLSEKLLETIASVDLQKTNCEGKKLRKKQLTLFDKETTHVNIDSTVSPKRLVKRASGTADKKRLQRAVALENGNKEGGIQVTTKKSVVFCSEKPADNVYSSETQIRFSIDDDVAAFKALMNKRHNRLTNDKSDSARQSKPAEKHESFSDKLKLKTSQSLQLDNENENDDDNLIQAQMSAFDFSVLRSKLESRLSGKQTSEEDLACVENSQLKQQNLAEIRSRLTDTGNIKRAMNKWLQMDKETSHQHK